MKPEPEAAPVAAEATTGAAADAENAHLKAQFAALQQELAATRDAATSAQDHYKRARAAHDEAVNLLEDANARIAELETKLAAHAPPSA
jgi:chromosome segregation ATPase